MTTEWVITVAAERVRLDSGNRGETSFTVTNPGTAPDRVVFELVAGDGGDPSWFSVEEPQRLVAGGASVAYLVKISPPAGTPAGEFWLQGRAYSADSAPEEGSRLSGRVAFEVAASAKPKTPWWPYAVAAGLLLVVLGVVGWLVFGGDGEDEPTAESSTPAPAVTPIRTGTVTLPGISSVSFENGTVAQGQNGDIFSSTLPFGPPGFLQVQGRARASYLGVVANPTRARCTSALLQVDPIPIQNLEPGGVLCVATNQGRIAVVTIREVDLRGGPGQLGMSFELFLAPQRVSG